MADVGYCKQQDLVEVGRAAGYTTELITIEVGSREILGLSDLCDLMSALNCSQNNAANLCLAVIGATLL